ncbi:MAG: T9SS type A sorting domain-containing protein [Bacteroidota bacterium]
MLFLLFDIAATSAQIFASCSYDQTNTSLCPDISFFTPEIQINTPTSTSSLLYSTWDHKNIFINTTFTVNSYFDITSSVIFFGPNGKIVVSNAHLKSTETRYFSCSPTGWLGISVETGGTLDYSGNEMGNAQIGITIRSSGAIKIVGNIFSRNNVDIYAVNVAANALILGNYFFCGAPTYTGDRSEAAIRLRKAVLTVGASIVNTSDLNFFVDHKVQIECLQGSTLNLYYGSFNCAQEHAILSETGNVNILGANNSTLLNSFYDNNQDIQSTGTNLAVSFSQFVGCKTNNIVSKGNTNQEVIKITNNFIYINDDNTVNPADGKNGIDIERSSGGVSTPSSFRNTIKDNIIDIQDFTNTTNGNQRRSAIKVEGFPGTHDYMLIDNNGIKVGPGGSVPSQAADYTSSIVDILMKETGGYRVQNNHIFSENIDNQSYRNRWALNIHAWESPSSDNELVFNQITGTNQKYDYGMCAYHFIESGPWDICNNLSDYTLRGFHLNNHCNDSDFRRNVIGHHNVSPITSYPSEKTGGLLMEVGSELGIQHCKHNHWVEADYSPDWGAWHKNVPDYSSSIFEYDPTLLSETPVPVAPVSGWFVPVFSCENGANHCFPVTPFSEAIDEARNKTILQNQEFTAPQGVTEWENRREVIAQLLRYPYLKNSNIFASTFYNEHIGSSAGIFAQFDEELNHAMTIDLNSQNILNNNYSERQSILIRMDSLEGTLHSSVADVNDNNDFWVYRSLSLQRLSELSESTDAVLANVSNNRANALQSCSQLLASLPEETVYERNQKILNGLRIKKAKAEPFSEGDYSELHKIALQCEKIAGKTILRAKNMLPPSDPASYLPDGPITNPCEEERNNNSLPEYFKVNLSPVPAQNDLQIHFEKSFTGSINVSDLSGRIILSKPNILQETEVHLLLERISTGTYFLLLNDTQGHKETKRFVVTK